MKSLKGKNINDIKLYILRKIQYHIYSKMYYNFGKSSVIESPLIIRNKEKINIGKGVTIRKNSRIEVINEYNGEKYNPLLAIGNNCTIEYNLHITCAKSVIIEDDVLIAGYVTIVDNNHSYYETSKPIKYNKLTIPKSVKICKGSFIGTGSIIMPGVIIGKHCTVGSNSVVTKSIPDYSVAVGNPAKVIKKYNFTNGIWEKV